MSIEDDVTLLERVPTLRLLGTDALRMLAIGSEQRAVARGATLFSAGDEADGVALALDTRDEVSSPGADAHDRRANHPDAMLAMQRPCFSNQ